MLQRQSTEETIKCNGEQKGERVKMYSRYKLENKVVHPGCKIDIYQKLFLHSPTLGQAEGQSAEIKADDIVTENESDKRNGLVHMVEMR